MSQTNGTIDYDPVHYVSPPAKTLREKMEMVVVTASVALTLLVLSGHVLRQKSIWLRALHLPSSVIGGILGWLVFALIDLAGGGEIADAWFAMGWDVLPGFCTTIVFACLFLGTPVPRASEVLESPRKEHLIFGLVLVFGQYVTGCLVTIVCRWADESLHPSFATIMPYGYAGGPVVAEAMQDLYAEGSFNYPDGYPLALLAATLGMFVGVIVGAVLVNMAPLSLQPKAQDAYGTLDPAAEAGEGVGVEGGPNGNGVQSAEGGQNANGVQGAPGPRRRQGSGGGGGGGGGGLRRRVARLGTKLNKAMVELKAGAPDSDHYHLEARPVAAQQTVSLESLDSFMFHLSLVGVVILVGYVLRIPLVAFEELFPADSFFAKANLLSCLPLFLFCLLGGLAFQRLIDRFFTDVRTGASFVDRPTVVAISNTAQDILICAAIARLGRNGLPPGVSGLGNFFRIIFERGIPFILICAAGLLWGVVAFWQLAPRLLPDFWVERGLIEFGVSIGATSTGLLLLRMADPEGKTPVLRDFTLKQIFHVLITGGGFFDVLVPIPLTATSYSCWPLLVVCLVLILTCLACHPGAGRVLIRLVSSGRTRTTPITNTSAAVVANAAPFPVAAGDGSESPVADVEASAGGGSVGA